MRGLKMKCYECGITYKKWEQTEQSCGGTEHDWEEGMDEEGDA